jgi:predicted nucleic acid-binding protein
MSVILKDEPYINLAIVAGASYLVSRDNDILDLSALSSLDGERLRHQAHQLQILNPVAFLAEIRSTLEASGQPG